MCWCIFTLFYKMLSLFWVSHLPTELSFCIFQYLRFVQITSTVKSHLITIPFPRFMFPFLSLLLPPPAWPLSAASHASRHRHEPSCTTVASRAPPFATRCPSPSLLQPPLLPLAQPPARPEKVVGRRRFSIFEISISTFFYAASALCICNFNIFSIKYWTRSSKILRHLRSCPYFDV